MLSLNSKIREIYANPVGHDALAQLLRQVGASQGLLTNPLVGNLRLGTVSRLVGKQLPADFFEALLTLLNSEQATVRPADPTAPISPAWWKEAVFYQIYPRSFKDSNGDGIGDLGGIIDRLDYLQDLGVTALWLSPAFDSPGDDNGYDIRDYRAILSEFGSMADFDRLLAEAHRRGIRLIMDLVVNHTSDEHPWFRQALADPASPYRDYYFFRPAADGRPFNNWTSFFSGPAWRQYPEQQVQALHLFSAKQMDLNWDNPAVRHEVADLVNWWLDKGVDGFRMDVINYISKRAGLPDGDPTIGSLMGYQGVEHYFYGPHLGEYLRELRQRAFEPHQAFSVGETPGLGLQLSQLLTAASRQELDMVFSFDQLETPGHTRFDDYCYDLNYLKRYLMDWQAAYPNDCWMSLFYENHDNPRMISKVNPDPAVRQPLGKLLAAIQLSLKGTPFIFQGQELGAVNQDFRSIDQLRDVESLNLYQELLAGGADEAAAFAKVLAGSRDHARVPLAWTAGDQGGFCPPTVEPWLAGSGEQPGWSAAEQAEQPDSVLAFYRQLIALRRAHPAALVYGRVHFVAPTAKDYFAYWRVARDEAFFVECNLGQRPRRLPLGRPDTSRFELLVDSYETGGTGSGIGGEAGTATGGELAGSLRSRPLRPYEARVYRLARP